MKYLTNSDEWNEITIILTEMRDTSGWYRGYNISYNIVGTRAAIYLLRDAPGSCSETCPLLSQGGNLVIFMRVEEEVDVKEEDIPMAVKTFLQQK